METSNGTTGDTDRVNSTPDLLPQITGLYRLLDLVNDQGSAGIVDKIIVSQESIGNFINQIHPGSYESETKIDFTALDGHVIKPLGIYGSIPAIVGFLDRLGCISQETRRLLLIQQGGPTTATQPSLRPGLYALKSENHSVSYIIFWPELATWQDGSIWSAARNRVTFMRYLTKLCDQVICLISDEHSAQLISEEQAPSPREDDEEDEEEDDAGPSRIFQYRVERTAEERETASSKEGFSVSHRLFEAVPRLPYGAPEESSLDIFQPRLVLGDTSQAVLRIDFIPESVENIPFEESWETTTFREKIGSENSPTLILGDRLSPGSMPTLFANGLNNRCGDVYTNWQRTVNDANEQRVQDEISEQSSRLRDLQKEMESIHQMMPYYLVRKAATLFPILSDYEDKLLASILDSRPDFPTSISISEAFDEVEKWLQKLSDARNGIPSTITQRTSRVRRVVDFVTRSGSRPIQIDPFPPGEQNNDGFPNNLPQMTSDPPGCDCRLCGNELERLTKSLKNKYRNWEAIYPEVKEIQNDHILAEIRCHFQAKGESEMGLALHELKRLAADALLVDAENRQTGVVLGIDHIEEETGRRSTREPSFRVHGLRTIRKKPAFRYTLHQLEVKSDDLHNISSNPHHICTPVIRQHPPPPIILPLNETMKYIQLVGSDRCLIVLSNKEWLGIYLDSVKNIASAIRAQRHVKRLRLDRLGQNYHIAVDETKCLFTVLSVQDASILIHTYIYNVGSRTLTSRRAVDITKFYHQKPEFSQFLFLAGTEELLLVEKGGTARIFSLVTEYMRPSTLELNETITAAFSSPDGACLFTIIQDPTFARIRCFHWTSFGANAGIEIPWPESVSNDSHVIVSSVGNKASTHIIFLDANRSVCSSLYIQITRNSSELTFRRNGIARSQQANTSTVSNSLINCHLEVWTLFPVYATIRRKTTESAIHHPRTITFVSSASEFPFSQYFTSLIRTLESTSRKPTRGILREIEVTVVPDLDVHSEPQGISELRAGDWLVGLLCLIPIHLAVTESNRFIPLKDGVMSSEFEQSLGMANAKQVSQALSFGWYESILGSYFARKPVKVVTSMGEQSVGKSFSLNHFVDTSFAGSAMRCTEGVWLSLTPTHDYLVVALDFEGVHSLERTPQEDTLLVLLNTAISNLVLFRNNFAISRDIAGLFTSFQSCSTVLNPDLDKYLFNSSLEIIIKDVTDADTLGIVQEFQQRFERIIQIEGENNFISRLHKGKIDIIPWPVIGEPRFYTLFNRLKRRLDSSPQTYQHASRFLTVLKMLMAKLKTNDWGPLDQNLAAQRAEYLATVLDAALSFGTIDPISRDPLTNLDTGEVISTQEDPGTTLYLESAKEQSTQVMTVHSCLRNLCEEYSQNNNRFETQDSDYLRNLTEHLDKIAEARISRVRKWLEVNTTQFQDNAKVLALFLEFDDKERKIRTGINICGSNCLNCNLRCLQHKEHRGNHHCHTDHKCPVLCDFPSQHTGGSVPACDLPAGHAGSHMCTSISHSCGLRCQLDEKDGCLNLCSKPPSHVDNGHLCSASLHRCGEPCSLGSILRSGTPLCTRRCVIDCNREHERHCCDQTLSCPVKCELCGDPCAGDHFHPLEEDAIHLCSQSHACSSKCQMPGICDIETTPRSVKETFKGAHGSFEYPKFTQVTRRLPCGVRIEANKTSHDGPHVHTLDPEKKHRCKERCGHCGYYCTLPLNHTEREHETLHGSMSHSEWVIEGDADAEFELEDRKYATGDNGAPVLCSMLCRSLGRHVHIDNCRTKEGQKCGGEGYEHVNRPNAVTKQDWITHEEFWARSGFKDPYSGNEKIEFGLCDHRCPAEEHNTSSNPNATASFCKLPLFHAPADPERQPTSGYISRDGHSYSCRNPAPYQRSYHIFFALDRSGSMTDSDRWPLPGTPVTQRIVQVANNRFGAVVSSLYGFLKARETANRSTTAAGVRRDAYTIVTFDHNATITLSNDNTKNSDQLLDLVLGGVDDDWGWTDFTKAIKTIQAQMDATWATYMTPVVIFLSDGEDDIEDSAMYDLCRAALRHGNPLSFHSVAFGPDQDYQSLRRMVTIAKEVYESAPRNQLMPPEKNPCAYHTAIKTVDLAETFLGIAESLRNTRAALYRI